MCGGARRNQDISFLFSRESCSLKNLNQILTRFYGFSSHGYGCQATLIKNKASASDQKRSDLKVIKTGPYLEYIPKM